MAKANLCIQEGSVASEIRRSFDIDGRAQADFWITQFYETKTWTHEEPIIHSQNILCRVVGDAAKEFNPAMGDTVIIEGKLKYSEKNGRQQAYVEGTIVSNGGMAEVRSNQGSA